MSTKRKWLSRAAAAGGVAAVLLATAGCGSSSDGEAGSGTTPTTDATAPADATTAPADATTSATGSSDGEPQQLTVVEQGGHYAITGAPHAGLVEIDVTNADQAAHELGLSRLQDGVTVDQLLAALQQGEKQTKALLVDPQTEITSAATAGAGAKERVIVPLEAGHYVATSFLPGPDGTPQVFGGMVGEFTVLPADGAPTPPTTAGVITLSDDGIDLPGQFGHGGWFEVENAGAKPHDFSVAKLADAALPDYFQCVAASFGQGSPVDQCPGTLAGGVTTLQPGASAYLLLDLGLGDYGYVSTQGNGDDFKAGLNGTFTLA